jgi:hypothetical protein
MLSDALPPARNRQPFHLTTAQLFALTGLLLGFVLLNACSVSSAASATSETAFRRNPFDKDLTLSGTLPAAALGVNFNATLNVSGGTAPYTFSISWGELPAGLAISTKPEQSLENPARPGPTLLAFMSRIPPSWAQDKFSRLRSRRPPVLRSQSHPRALP